jgi:hypothetical protein
LIVEEKTKKVLFQTFKKIRSSQKPSWFNLFMQKNQEGLFQTYQKNKKLPKTFLVYTSWWRKNQEGFISDLPKK